MKRYSEYKYSGVKWIREIPSHWEALRIKFIGRTIGGLTYSPADITSEDKGTIVLRSSNIQNNKLCFDDNVYVNKALSDKDYIKQGDLLICSRNGSADLVGKCAIIDQPIKAAFGAFMMVLRPTLTKNSRYVYYLSQVCIEKYKSTFKTSTINQLTNSLFGNIFSPYVYDSSEQCAIVSYLDSKVSKIDEYIAASEKKIAALDELKQTIIADAVTHGINQDVKMKDSGIKWIGEVPQHWDMKRSAILFSENKSKNTSYEFTHAMKFKYGSLVPKNEIGDVSEFKDTYTAYTIINKDDIAINCLNLNYDFVSQRVAISPERGILTSAYLIVTPRKGICPMFYNYLFKAMDSKKLFHGMGTGIRLTLSFVEFKKQIIPCPPLSEQEIIVSYIDKKVSEIDHLKASEQSQIDKLKEYKQRLISDVVTGKVKVTND